MVEDKISRNSSAGIHAEDCSSTKEASKEDEVEMARAEMSRVREENARLKMLLEKIEKDYNALQMRFVGICSQPWPEINYYAATHKNCTIINHDHVVDDDHKDIAVVLPPPSGNEEPELVSLSLGRSSSPIEPKNKHYHDHKASSSPTGSTKQKLVHQRIFDSKEGDLRLALDFNSLEDCKSDPVDHVQTDRSPENSLLESKDVEEGKETCSPGNKLLKATKSSGDDDLSQSGVKRPRVSVRTRCETPTMNDGCQWRKYGQKIAKGNPCPRAYYRCTIAPSCPVRKQVQRCAEDMSILITTYEGTHNHPLPISATAIASTTSAAASMLLSGSSTNSSQLASSTTTTTLMGLNVNPSDHGSGSSTRPYYMSHISSPTITLDLTSDPSGTTTTTSNQFNVFSSASFQSNIPRLTASTNVSFAPIISQPSMLVSSLWANGNYFNYGANNNATPYGKINPNMMGSSQPAGRTISQEHLDHQVPFLLQKNYDHAAAAVPSQQALTESLTKAITSDPNFRSVIAAAITTMVGGGGGGGASTVSQASNDKLEGLGKKLKWDDQTKAVINSSSNPPAGTNGKVSASSFLHQSSSSSFSTPRSLSLISKQQLPQPVPFSISKGAGAASPATSENVDQTNRMQLE